MEYCQQLERMVSRGFAVWGIIAEYEREGNLDTAIEGEVANPISEFCEGTCRIVVRTATTWAFNGL